MSVFTEFDTELYKGFDIRNYAPIGINYSNGRASAGLETIFSATGEGFLELATFVSSGVVGQAFYFQIIIDGVTYTFNYTSASAPTIVYGFAWERAITVTDTIGLAVQANAVKRLALVQLFDPSVVTHAEAAVTSPLPIFFKNSLVTKAYYNSSGNATIRGGLKI